MKRQNKLISLLLSLFLLLFTLIPQSALTVKAEGNSEMAVHFIDVGQGNAILVQSGGQNLLYDGGDQSHADLIISYLQEQNVENIDYMIASHYDEDHIGGLVPCIDNFSVSNIFGPDYVHTSNLFNNFMNTATANAIIVQYPSVGETFDFGTGSFTVLAPNGISQNSNDNSLVIKLENGSNSFIFTGDAEETSEQDMISTGMNLDSDVLCLGHHGSSSSTSWDLLEATSPSWAVVSCGAGNSYGHPTAETMGKLSDMDIPVYRTDEQGTCIALSSGETIDWNQDPCNDYTPGDERDGTSSDTVSASSQYQESTAVQEQETTTEDTAPVEAMVWISATGSKYHSIPDCGNMNPANAHQETESQALAEGYEACKKCW